MLELTVATSSAGVGEVIATPAIERTPVATDESANRLADFLFL
ncbi:hypothetical protein [Enterococcus saccharolyticus]|nr:hypothetical protein [Enterococcus saccharolyticus]OJG88466.1 hypothetical protein RV16_GL000208 [Enterococcus saccharolyticus]